MSTEFVRCPACRSLIPAVSKVCRMCGADLGGGAKSDDESGKKSGRVRQRTMSQSNEELAQAAHQLRADFTPAADDAPSARSVNEVGNVDPLSAYIEEIDSGIPSSASIATGTPRTEARNSSAFGVGMMADVEDAAQTVAVSPESLESARPRVIVETGSRRSGKGSGLSFGKGREDPFNNKNVEAKSVDQSKSAAQVAHTAQAAPEQKLAPEMSSTHREQSAPAPQRGSMQLGKASPRNVSEPRASAEETSAKSDNERVESHAVTNSDDREIEQSREMPQVISRSASRSQHIPLKGGKISAGRLFGWLVSFKESDGRAIELREGRFFITRSSVKESDLVIDHESISTPHALMHISADMGLRVHDVISEKGLFVKRRGSDEFQRMSETVEIQHGDFLRFGEVEYQVCLISEVGAK